MTATREIERATLGCCLKDRSQVESVSRIVSIDDFSAPENQVLWEALLQYAENVPDLESGLDVAAFIYFLGEKQALNAAGGEDYVRDCLNYSTGGANALHNARLVRQSAVKRKFTETLNRYTEVFSNGADLAEAIPKLEADVQSLKDDADVKGESPLKFTTLSTVASKDIQWFWPNRIPAGMFSMIVGNPGIGKSFITMDIAAKVTTGDKWPDAINTIEPGSVLLFSDEESLEYAIKPRLVAHGADCSKVFAFNSLELKGQYGNFTLQDSLTHLETYLDSIPDCRLIVFDPITAYLGDINANANAEVRGVLLGLQQLAQRRSITVIGVSHFSKKSDLDAIYRTLGSTAFTAAARSVWAVVTEKTETDNDRPARLLLPIKSNYSVDADGLRFNIVDGRVIYDKQAVTTDIDRVMQGGHIAAQKDRAQQWLRDRLGSDTVLAADVLNDGEREGLSGPTLQRAATELGIIKRRSALHNNKYVWSLSV